MTIPWFFNAPANLETFDAIVSSQDYDNWKIDTLAWPQLMLLRIITNEKAGINLSDLISKSIEYGINKGWEDYLETLINKDYVEEIGGLYKLLD